LGDNIGSGGFGEVYSIHKTLSDGTIQKFILKKLEMSDITELDKVTYESKQLRKLFHKNIVLYEDEFLHMEERTFENKYVYIIIMEYCEKGDLTDIIREYKQLQLDKDPDTTNFSLPEHRIMKIFIEVCDALKYIHSRDLIHRDIKSPNIFITDDDTAKLGDFGLCIQGKTIETKTKYSAVGTDCYLAPELHKKQLFQKGKASDVWSVGCILLEMLTATPLWELEVDLGIKAIEDPAYISEFIQSKVPAKYDVKIKRILKKMMEPDP
jgi:serine/threonine protein kinase